MSGQIPDRRDADRFPIEQEVRYRLKQRRSAAIEGTGQTVNISSNGVLFRSSDSELTVGRQIELFINWPARLNNKCHLRLVARGRINRVLGDQVAVRIVQYEFRTAGGGTSAVNDSGIIA